MVTSWLVEGELETTGFASQAACSPRGWAHAWPGGHERGLVLSLTLDGTWRPWRSQGRTCSKLHPGSLGLITQDGAVRVCL